MTAETTTEDREDTEEDTEEDMSVGTPARSGGHLESFSLCFRLLTCSPSLCCVLLCVQGGGRDDYRSRAPYPPQQSRGNRLYVANIHGADVPALEKLFDKYGRIVDM